MYNLFLVNKTRRSLTNKLVSQPKIGGFINRIKPLSYLGWLLPFAFINPALGAQQLYLSYGPLEFSLPVSALRVYAKEGRINEDLSAYTRSLKPAQREQLQRLLVTKIKVTPVAISQFLYSPIGEILLQRIGEVIQSESRISGFYAIRAAMIQAAADPEGLTLLNVLQKFPTYGIRINTGRSFQIVEEVSELVRQTETAIANIEQQSLTEVSAKTLPTLPQFTNIGLPGFVRYQKQTFTANDLKRNRDFPVDIYLPQQSGSKLTPLVVISHGLGGDRNTFKYLAEHLASYGFAVAVLEHPGSNAKQLDALTRGLASDAAPATELIDRPLDIKYLLDELARSLPGRLNLKQVGVIGQSFGGYTTLALAGAKINLEQLNKDCQKLNETLNLSLLVQCNARRVEPEKYNLKDERVKAAIAINPFDSSIFGQSGISNIKIPVMLVASSNDTVTPALPEQIQPFGWLTNPEKYLVVIKEGTHFSTLDRSRDAIPLSSAILGPDPRIAFQYIRVLSLAFFQTHLVGNPQYQQFLSASYAQSISKDPLPLVLIQSLREQEVGNKEQK